MTFCFRHVPVKSGRFCASGACQVAPGDHELRPRRSLEVRGSLKLQNGGLRALEEAWDNFVLEELVRHPKPGHHE